MLIINESELFNYSNTIQLICERHNSIVSQNTLMYITQKAGKVLYDYCVYNCLSGDFLNKYYFPVLVPIGVCGNILSFLVSTLEIFASQIPQFETNVALKINIMRRYVDHTLGALFLIRTAGNTSGPESIK